MRHLQGHFLVATLAEPGPGAEPLAQFEPPVSHEVVNSRQALLHFCQTRALQFNSLRYAHFSTMRILQEMLHPAPKAEEGGAAYCLPGCLRGRQDDGSMMIACDVCDNWFHTGCLAHHTVPSGEDESFVCPLCVESKAEVYLGGLQGTPVVGGVDDSLSLGAFADDFLI